MDSMWSRRDPFNSNNMPDFRPSLERETSLFASRSTKGHDAEVFKFLLSNSHWEDPMTKLVLIISHVSCSQKVRLAWLNWAVVRSASVAIGFGVRISNPGNTLNPRESCQPCATARES